MDELRATFPGLRLPDCAVTSQKDRRYNCIAHAAGDSRRFWDPARSPEAYWPKGVPRSYTLEAYEAAFATLGYKKCGRDNSLQAGIEKIAIFANDNGPQHAARQLENGSWTSKLGVLEDICHPLLQIEGTQYGMVASVMWRPRRQP